jgi:hypothetical protein
MSTQRRLVLLLAAALAAGPTHAQGPIAAVAEPFAKPDWTVARAWCPIGCSEATTTLLKDQVGRAVHLGAARLEAPFLDACEGSVRFGVRLQSPADLVAEVDAALAPRARRLAVADLGVAAAEIVHSAWALCHGATGETTFARLLVIAPDRVLLLFEEQSLVELR